jgi:pyroglutamyl-peptidase
MNEVRYSRVLVTGFGPFGNVTDNPSSKLASSCGAPYALLEVGFAAVDAWVKSLDPSTFDILLMMGVASGRDLMCTEMFARNFVGNHADVRGQVRFGSIDVQMPLIIAANLWDAHHVAEWTRSLPVKSSYDAGNYLCNYLSFKAILRFPEKRVGFLHVPTEERLSLEKQAATLKVILDELV